jgi:hypothetical protein
MVRQASVPRTAGLTRLTPPAARNALPAPAPSEAGAGADDHEPVGSKVQAESRVSQSSALIAAHGGEECYRPHPPLTPGPNSRAADTYPGRVGNTQCASSSGRQRWSARTRHPLSAGRPRHHTETPAQSAVHAPAQSINFRRLSRGSFVPQPNFNLPARIFLLRLQTIGRLRRSAVDQLLDDWAAVVAIMWRSIRYSGHAM